ncbi:hypothetical protein SAMN04487983_106110 [Streptomyces sp. yr375]|uniref:hypothetical protein n=1 Tax=Streptomyces sp. yr375 TaxID=1761906 RepID=UPI0008C1276C|nr:hypothetical protein [Streptomyces sp. yr375]SES46713.1 hypothetical protein SAMN04487983_106110 [Streptomyces sp. yr375]
MAQLRQPNDTLRSMLVRSAWTLEALARSVNAVAAETGRSLTYDRTSVSKWLAGVLPRDDVVPLLVEAFSRRLGRPLTSADLGLGGAVAAAGRSAARGVSEPAVVLAELAAGQADFRRRTALESSPYQLLDSLVRPVSAPRVGVGVSPYRSGRAEVQALRTASVLFASLMEALGGGTARVALATFLAEDVTTWLHAHASDTVRGELFTGAAELTLLLARMNIDLHAHGLAQRYLDIAFALASEVGGRTTEAIALRVMSAQALDLGHHEAALHLAEAAESAVRESPGAVRAFVDAQLALAQAATEQHRSCLRLFDRVDRNSPDGEGAFASPFGSYSRASALYQRAGALTHLGEVRLAAQDLTVSLRHRAHDETRARALTLSRLAGLHLRMGHVDEACAAWLEFLDLYPLLHSARADRELTGLIQKLRPHGRHHAVAHVLERAGGHGYGGLRRAGPA